MPAQGLVARPPRTDDELWEFVATIWGFEIPRTPICPNHRPPFQAFADAYFARAPVIVWKASRGFGGKSNLLAILGLTEQIALGAEVNILGGSGQQSESVIRRMGQAWNAPRAPRSLLATEPGRQEVRLTNGATARALLCSHASVRGPHPPRLRIDEVDEVDIPILDAALGQPMSQRGVEAQTVLSSTHQHPDGTMTEVLHRATEKGWPVFEWCYRETMQPHGWLSQAEIARKRIELTASMWKVEIELQEPAAEGRAILTEAVEAMFLTELGEFAGDDRELVAIEGPSQYSRYGTGIDWAKQKDWTVITTLKADANPFLLVAFERLQRRPWPEMVAHADARVKAYPGAAFHGALGVGDVVSDYVTTNIEGFIEAGRDRQDLFTEYIAGIERGEVRSPRIDFAYRQHRYCRNEDLFKASGHPPDSFVAGALAYRAARSISGGGSPVRAGGTRSSGGMPSREGMPL